MLPLVDRMLPLGEVTVDYCCLALSE